MGKPFPSWTSSYSYSFSISKSKETDPSDCTLLYKDTSPLPEADALRQVCLQTNPETWDCSVSFAVNRESFQCLPEGINTSPPFICSSALQCSVESYQRPLGPPIFTGITSLGFLHKVVRTILDQVLHLCQLRTACLAAKWFVQSYLYTVYYTVL